MSYSRVGLQRVGPQNSNAPTVWTYGTTDALTTIDGSGYFNDAADVLQVGDWILVSSTSTYGIMIVNSNSGGVVDVTNAIAVGTGDSD